jgi:hypothetical protein
MSLSSATELAENKATLALESIAAVRQTVHCCKKSSRGGGGYQLYKSSEVSMDLPSHASGMQCLCETGTVTSESSRMTKVTLTNQELRSLLDFPLVVKKCAYGGPYRTAALGGPLQYNYLFTDSVVDAAFVKITHSKLTIQFNSRYADAKDAVVDLDEQLKDVS